MSKLLQRTIVVLMFRVDWRKLLAVSTFFTIAGVFVLQTYIVPYPLTTWFISPLQTVASDHPLNNTLQLTKPIPLETVEQIKPAITVPIVLLNLTESNESLPATEKGSLVSGPSIREETKVDKVLKIDPLPSHTTAYHEPQRHVSLLRPSEALVYAKDQILHAQLVSGDPYLHAPLFRNVSVFKRSYELMEMILKVYIYKDGAKPIFHHPHLRGIYASEGWFMRLMEGNRQFVTQDPEKAHLFYLPYSARQLQIARYVPGSHNLKPLSVFLKNYVNTIAKKYPFWNRTHGSDHFLVSCHDWGPYIVKEHNELSRNTIKALCNADLSEGVFVAGKDVSLPETTIRNPKRPLRNLGGRRVSQRPILAFFAGHMHGRVRPRLLKYWKGRDEDMKIYGLLPISVARKMSYVEHMKSSKYCLCPMGYEVNSPRIVEAIYYECVPVIIADNFVPPFDEVLDYSAFSVIVAEKDVPKLKEILLAIPMRRYLSMQTNVKMLQKHFLWNPTPTRYDLFHMILHSIWLSRLNQIQTSQL